MWTVVFLGLIAFAVLGIAFELEAIRKILESDLK